MHFNDKIACFYNDLKMALTLKFIKNLIALLALIL